MQRGSDSHSLKEVVRLNEIITAKLSESKASPWSSFWSSKFVVNKWDETFGLTSLWFSIESCRPSQGKRNRVRGCKDTKFQRQAKYFLLNTMATWLDPNFAHRWSAAGSNQVAIVLYRKSFVSLWNLVSLSGTFLVSGSDFYIWRITYHVYLLNECQ